MFKKAFGNQQRFSGAPGTNQPLYQESGLPPGMAAYPNQQMPPFPPQQGMPPSGMYPAIQFDRLQLDIKENRRRINNLAKRIIRIENYLRIRDTTDYSILEEEEDIHRNFTM